MIVGGRSDKDKNTEPCEPCQEGNVSTQADGYCINCEEYMCQTCFESHLKLKVCRNHVLEGLDKGRRQSTQKLEDKCKKHTTEVIKYYCRNHDSVGCGDCLVAFHQQCETKFIRDIARYIEESPDFKNILKEVDNLEDLKSEIDRSLERNRNKNTESHDKAIQEIQQRRTDINTWLNNATSQTQEEEMNIWKENEILLSILEDWIKIISNMINKVRDEINTEKYSSENLFIRVVEIKSELSEFNTKSVPEIKSSLEIKPFTFEPSQDLIVFTKSAKLGVIKVGGGSGEDLPGADGPYAGTGGSGTVDISEDPVRDQVERELEKFRKMAALEKEKYESMQRSYDTLKKKLDDQVSLISSVKARRGEQSNIPLTTEQDQEIFRLKREISFLNDLNNNLEGSHVKKCAELKASQKSLDSLKKEYSLYKYQSKARQEHDQIKTLSLLSELKKIRE